MKPSHPKNRKSKYPKIDHSYESADYPGLYYAGTVTHSLDYRKSAGGFIHGFRYTGELSVLCLYRLTDSYSSTNFLSNIMSMKYKPIRAIIYCSVQRLSLFISL